MSWLRIRCVAPGAAARGASEGARDIEHGIRPGGTTDMVGKGWSHVSLGTLDMNATRAFYEGVLGFKAVRCDIIKVHGQTPGARQGRRTRRPQVLPAVVGALKLPAPSR